MGITAMVTNSPNFRNSTIVMASAAMRSTRKIISSRTISVIGLGIVYSVSQMSIVQGSILSWIVCAGLIALETKLSKDVAILPPSAAASWSGSDCAAEAMAGARLEVAAMMTR